MTTCPTLPCLDASPCISDIRLITCWSGHSALELKQIVNTQQYYLFFLHCAQPVISIKKLVCCWKLESFSLMLFNPVKPDIWNIFFSDLETKYKRCMCFCRVCISFTALSFNTDLLDVIYKVKTMHAVLFCIWLFDFRTCILLTLPEKYKALSVYLICVFVHCIYLCL